MALGIGGHVLPGERALPKQPHASPGCSPLPSMHCHPYAFASRREPGHHAPLPHSQGLGPPSNRDIVGNSNAATRLQSHGLPRGVPGWQWTLTRGGEAELMGTTGNRVPGKPGERDMGLRSHGAPGTFREHEMCQETEAQGSQQSCDLREQRSANEALSSVSLEYVSWT